MIEYRENEIVEVTTVDEPEEGGNDPFGGTDRFGEGLKC